MARYGIHTKSYILLLIFGLIDAAALGDKQSRVKRIVNGNDELTEGWKFNAFINFRQPKAKWKVCGASLVSKDWVLTVASCLEDIADEPHYVTVGVGIKKLKYIPGRHNYSVSQIVVHPDYIMPHQRKLGIGYSIDNDIALMKLTRPIEGNVNPVKMADKDDDISESKDASCRATGWGIKEPIKDLMIYFYNNYAISQRLQEMDVKMISKKTCIKENNITEWEGNFYGMEKDLARLICGVSKKGKNQMICTGDTGGPLVCTKGNDPILYGLIIGGDYMCRPGKYSMFFTEVAKHRDWIDKTIGNNKL